MRIWLSHNRTALFKAIAGFSISFGLVLLLLINFDLSQLDIQTFLLLLGLIVSIFVSRNTFYRDQNQTESIKIGDNLKTDLVFNSEELYVQLYKNSPVPYFILDMEGHVKSANIAAVRMLNIAQAKISGINIFNYLQSDQLEHLDFLVEKYRSGVSVSDEMVRVKRSDNREAWALLSLFSSNSASGNKIGLLTLVDVTKQKKAEDAKSEFVSLASHQLRTPIAGMKWSAELLQMDNPESLTERQHKYIDRLLISINRMAVLVDDFLRVSRFELGTFQPEFKHISLIEMFKDIMDDQSIRVKQKNITVKTFFDESVDKIVTDPNLMRMTITNLYTNAIKYSRDAGTVHLGFGRKDENLIITVADNGMGIPIEDQDSIFVKLFRASNAVRDVPDGTGLGLYIAHEAVSVLKGNISFTSTENVGTTFEILLPLELAKEKESKKS